MQWIFNLDLTFLCVKDSILILLDVQVILKFIDHCKIN